MKHMWYSFSINGRRAKRYIRQKYSLGQTEGRIGFAPIQMKHILCILLCFIIGIQMFGQVENTYRIKISGFLVNMNAGFRVITEYNAGNEIIDNMIDDFDVIHLVNGNLKSFHWEGYNISPCTPSFPLDGVMYTKGQYSYTKEYYYSQAACNILVEVEPYLTITVDDPVFVGAVTNFNINNGISIPHGKFYDNGKSIKLQYAKNSASGTWSDYSPALTLSSSGGTAQPSFGNFIASTDLYNTGFYFRILKTFEDGTLSYGNIVGPYVFYDYPQIAAVSGAGVACQSGSITLTGKYLNYSGANTGAHLRIKRPGDKDWIPIGKTLNPNANLNYASDIKPYLPSGQIWLGQDILIQPYKMFGSDTIKGGYQNTPDSYTSIVFLPVADITVSPQSPVCYDGEGRFVITNNSQLHDQINLTFYKFSGSSLGPGSKTITYNGGTYYYLNGRTLQRAYSPSSFTITSADFNDPNFKFTQGLYCVSAWFNSTTANCPRDSALFYIIPPNPVYCTFNYENYGGSYNALACATAGKINYSQMTNGVGPYVVSKEDGTGTVTAGSNNSGSFSLDIVSYNGTKIKMADNHGCSVMMNGSYLFNVNFQKRPEMTLTPSAVSPSCVTGQGTYNDGAINGTISNGMGSYTIKVYKESVSNDNLRDAISSTASAGFHFPTAGNIYFEPGNYVVSVQDGTGCSITPGVTINAPEALSFTRADVTHPLCWNNKGTLVLAATGGTNSFTYSVTGQTDNSTGTFTGLPTGACSYSVKDSKNCSISGNTTINSAPDLILTASPTPVACSAADNGTVTLTATNYQGTNLSFSVPKASKVSSGGESQVTFSNLSYSSSSYTARFTDGAGCTKETTFDISIDPFVFKSITSAPTPCEALHTGAIDFTVDKGNASYTYQLLRGSDIIGTQSNVSTTSGNFTSLYPGTYTLKAWDKYNCSTEWNNIAIAATEPVITLTATPSSNAYCEGSTNVSIGIARKNGNVSVDGIMNYSFTRNGSPYRTTQSSQTDFSEDNFPEGSYTIEVTDDIGCKGSTTATIDIHPMHLQLDDPILSPSVCAGSPTGSIGISQKAGTGFDGVNFTLSPIDTVYSNGKFSNIPSGDYRVTATDGRNCWVSKDVTVSANDNPVTITPSLIKNQTCNDIKDGAFSVTASSVQGTQTYTITEISNISLGASVNVASASYNNLDSGTYRIRAVDNNQCSTTIDFPISNLMRDPKPLLDTSMVTACRNATNGKLIVHNDPRGSTPKYRYTIGAKALYAETSDAKVTFDNLPRGTYIITAKDTLGCQDTAKFTVGVSADSIHIVSIDTTYASCVRASNGTAKIVASGLDKSNTTDKYTLICNQDTLKGDSVIFNHLPVNSGNSHHVTVQDRYGCRDDSTFVISIGNTLHLLDRPVVNAACPGSSDGIIKIRRMFGTPGYSYTLTSASYTLNFNTSDTLVTINNLPAGSYTVSVEDVNHCLYVQPGIILTQPDTIKFFTNHNNFIRRKGDATGTMLASMRDGNRKYKYEWYELKNNVRIDSGRTVAFDTIYLNHQYAGEYLLRVRDTANCFVNPTGWLEHRYMITEPENPLSVNISRNTPVRCYEEHNGEFRAEASGGWGVYTYGLDTVNMFENNVFSGLVVDTLQVYVKDNAGIIVSREVIVTQPSALKAGVTDSTDAICYRASDGSATLNITGGNGAYEISSDGTNWIKGYAISTLDSGLHTIQVRDSLGCATSASVHISHPSDIRVLSRSITDTRCGFNNGSISATITGGTPGYTYNWSLNENPISSNSNSISNLYSGSYRLSATDKHNCNRTFALNVSDITDLSIDTIITQRVSCWGRPDGKASIQLSRGNPPYSITWPDSSHNTSVAGLAAGDYYVLVTDVERCKVFHDFTISTPVNISLESITRTNPLCEGVENGELSINPTSEFGGFSYLWSNGKNSSSLSGLFPGSYQVTVTDANDCSNTFDFNLQYQYNIKPNLGRDLTLCKGKSFTLNPGVYREYRWGSDNGTASTKSELVVDKAGSYFVEVQDNDRCIGRDTVNIALSETVENGKLLISSGIEQNDTVMLFEASWPVPDSIQFRMEGCNVLSGGPYYRKVVFPDTGLFTIVLNVYLNDCMDILTEQVKVEPRNNPLKPVSSRLIQEYTVSPNPNTGSFNVEVRLREKADITLRMANVGTGVINDVREYKGLDVYTVPYNLNVTSGMYILYLQAEKEAKSRTMIIQK